MGNNSRKHALNDICAVETIHAVRAHDTSLSVCKLTCLSSKRASFVQENVELHHCVAKLKEFLVHDCNEFGQVFPLHFFALAMEVKPSVMDVGVIHLLHKLSHFCSDSQLAAFLVNQIYEVLLVVVKRRL